MRKNRLAGYMYINWILDRDLESSNALHNALFMCEYTPNDRDGLHCKSSSMQGLSHHVPCRRGWRLLASGSLSEQRRPQRCTRRSAGPLFCTELHSTPFLSWRRISRVCGTSHSLQTRRWRNGLMTPVSLTPAWPPMQCMHRDTGVFWRWRRCMVQPSPQRWHRMSTVLSSPPPTAEEVFRLRTCWWTV